MHEGMREGCRGSRVKIEGEASEMMSGSLVSVCAVLN